MHHSTHKQEDLYSSGKNTTEWYFMENSVLNVVYNAGDKEDLFIRYHSLQKLGYCIYKPYLATIGATRY